MKKEGIAGESFIIDYESSEVDGSLVSDTLYESDGLSVETLTATLRKPCWVRYSLAQGTCVMRLNPTGTMLLRARDRPTWRVIPPTSATLSLGPVEFTTYMSRGEHMGLYFIWPAMETRALYRWIMETDANAMRRAFFVTSGSAMDANPAGLIKSMRDMSRKNPHQHLPQLFAHLHTLVGRVLVAPNELTLASIPPDIPDSVQGLLEQVKKNPTGEWSLKEASNIAGYSPFHLSRTFKTLVGYGFPEFVDRCRTELAVAALVSSEEPVDDIASRCGFGSSHGLRESVKEYLGLLPSELRALRSELPPVSIG